MDETREAPQGRKARIEFTDHARTRMKERRVSPEDVAIVIAEPDEIRYGEDGEIIAAKQMGRRLLEVVYIEAANAHRVITVMVV